MHLSLLEILAGACVIIVALKYQSIRSILRSKHDVPQQGPKRPDPDLRFFPRSMKNKQGLWLMWAQWRPDGNWLPPALKAACDTYKPQVDPHREARGSVFIVHGLGDYAAHYDAMAARFTHQGYVVFCLEHQGHGGSEGNRKYVERFDDYVDDYELFVDQRLAASPELQGRPKFLLGVSLGGLIATHLGYRRPTFYTGVVLGCPALEADEKAAGPTLKAIARTLSRWTPKLPLKDLPPALISFNEQSLTFMKQCPLGFPEDKMTVRWGAEVLGAIDRVWAGVEKCSAFPYLILHGTQDAVCTLAGSQHFHQRSVSQDKTMKVLDGAAHDWMADCDRSDQAYGTILAWMDERH